LPERDDMPTPLTPPPGRDEGAWREPGAPRLSGLNRRPASRYGNPKLIGGGERQDRSWPVSAARATSLLASLSHNTELATAVQNVQPAALKATVPKARWRAGVYTTRA
jgi:hypothetical protein